MKQKNMNSDKKTSVVITCHNYGKFLGEAIESAISQTVQPKEIIVVDDSSTDNTEKVAESFGNKISYYFVDFKNAQKSRNFGLSKTTGKYVVFLDADDYLDKEYLFFTERELDENNNLSLIYTNRINFSHKEECDGETDSKEKWLTIDFDYNILKEYNYISLPSLIRKDGFSGFDENINRFQDWDAWLTFLKDKKAKKVEKFLFYVRFHGNNKTLTVENDVERIKVMAKHKMIEVKKEEKINVNNAKSIIENKNIILFLDTQKEDMDDNMGSMKEIINQISELNRRNSVIVLSSVDENNKRYKENLSRVLRKERVANFIYERIYTLPDLGIMATNKIFNIDELDFIGIVNLDSDISIIPYFNFIERDCLYVSDKNFLELSTFNDTDFILLNKKGIHNFLNFYSKGKSDKHGIEKAADLNKKLIPINEEIIKKQREIISQKEEEISFLKSSKFWKLRHWYFKIKFLIFYPDKFLIKYFKKTKYLVCSFLESYRKEGRNVAVRRLFSYIKTGKGKADVQKELRKDTDEDKYGKWIENIEAPFKKKNYSDINSTLNKLNYKPKISVLMPVFNSNEIFLRKAIFSVIYQYYQNWELCIVDDCSDKKIVKTILKEFQERDNRIKVISLEKNAGISETTNKAAEMATGEFIGFLDHDDLLEPEALLENIKVLNVNRDADFIYSDDDKIDENGDRYDPQFKPDWSPELLLSYCYVSHFKLIRRSLFLNLGGFRKEFDGSQDYDFVLRLGEKTDKIFHIPKILYHWRSLPGSVAKSASEKPVSIERGRLAVKHALDRRNIRGSVVVSDFAKKSNLGVYKINFSPSDYSKKVTIIIPTKDKIDILSKCIDSIEQKTNYKNYEIMVVNNNSNEETEKYLKKKNIKYINIKTDNFNFSKINNIAAEKSDSEFILFLNNDTKVVNSNWLLELVGVISLNEKIGAVGARLIFPDKRIQHAGVVLGLHGFLAGHANKLLGFNSLGYLSYNLVMRNYSAVTAACMLTRKSLFKKLKGFDEKNLAVAYSDIDYCLRLVNDGYRTAYNPEALLYHYEGYSRGFNDNKREPEYFGNKWKEIIKNDPFYNINLSLDNERFEIRTK